MTATAVRPRGVKRTALDVPNPKPNTHYLWAADSAGHPQGYSRYKTEGFTCVPASEAKAIGMDGYVDESGLEVVKDSANVIRFGDLILMSCTVENFNRIKADKFQQYDAFDGTVEAEAEAKFESVHEEYKRRKRGD